MKSIFLYEAFRNIVVIHDLYFPIILFRASIEKIYIIQNIYRKKFYEFVNNVC